MFPVASDGDIERFEAWVGSELPPLLARIYREVANGGVGPNGDGPVVESEHDSLHEFLEAWLEDARLSPFDEIAPG